MHDLFKPIAGDCRVYWGSHGCGLARGHDRHAFPHACGCGGRGAAPPYFGRLTLFYGEDLTLGERIRSRVRGWLSRARDG